MTLFASKSTRGFYDPEINTVIPDDAVEISVEFHRELLAGQSEGMIIDWNKKGVPFLKAAPELTVEQLNENVAAQRQAAYAAEADPLFYQYQRGDIEKQVWLDKILEIKARYPKAE